MQEFLEIDTWVFDLDNTLYPRHCNLFSQIDVLMTDNVVSLTGLDRVNARKLQKDLYRDYGTTLKGLMETHQIDPHEFLAAVHNIDYSPLPSNPKLGSMLNRLPGRKIIYTNGSVDHARNTLDAMEIDHEIFESIFDIIASEFEPKPHAKPFAKFLEMHEINAAKAAMFEDLPRNLEPAKSSGMTTVLVTPDKGAQKTAEAWEHAEEDTDYIDHRTDDLDAFIKEILEIA